MKKKLLSLFDAKLWKFLLVGVLNTLVGNGLMFLLYNWAGLGYWPSTAISYALASVMSYFLNRYFTFKYKGSGVGVILRFTLNIVVCYLLSGASKTVRDNLAMLTGMCLFVGFNYLGQRFFAFREKTKED